VTLAARRPPTNDILDRARIEDVTLHDSSSNDRGEHQIDRHHRIRPVMVGASAAAPHDSGQAAGVQEHRGKRKVHKDGSGVHRGKRDRTDKMKLGRAEKEDTRWFETSSRLFGFCRHVSLAAWCVWDSRPATGYTVSSTSSDCGKWCASSRPAVGYPDQHHRTVFVLLKCLVYIMQYIYNICRLKS
jgi:hypothetical protein